MERFDFSTALRAMRQGQPMKRGEWGDGHYATVVERLPTETMRLRERSPLVDFSSLSHTTVRDFELRLVGPMLLRGHGLALSQWTPTTDDILARDWTEYQFK